MLKPLSHRDSEIFAYAPTKPITHHCIPDSARNRYPQARPLRPAEPQCVDNEMRRLAAAPTALDFKKLVSAAKPVGSTKTMGPIAGLG